MADSTRRRRGRYRLHPEGNVPVTRRRAGSANPRMKLERPTGRFTLAPGLAAPGDIRIDAAVGLVCEDWHRQLANRTIGEQCIDRYIFHTRSMAARAQAIGLTHVDQLDSSFLFEWARLRRHGQGEVGTGSRQVRLSAASAFFNTAQCLGLYDENPAVATREPMPTPRHVRPLTSGQIEQMKRTAVFRVHRLNGRTVPESKTPAAFALTLLGATNGENSQVRVRDVDLPNRRVWLHAGGYRTYDRWVPIDDDWCLQAISTRIDILAQTSGGEPIADRWLVYDSRVANPTAAKRSAATADLITGLMRKAGVYTPGVTRVESIREYLAGRVFAQTGRVEAVAQRLGMSSLDAAAHLVDYDWPSAYALPEPAGDLA